MVIPPPHPSVAETTKPISSLKEPGFEELLEGPYPYRSPEMPEDRPLRLHCFLERDDAYFAELERLKQAVVMHTKATQWEMGQINAGDYACRTGLVTKEELQISELTDSRFLILLPQGLDPDTFINATPQEAWDEGITFQPWSPTEDAEISIPAYKVLVNLVGIPPHLRREKFIIQAVARFGVYLGTVKPENPESVASCLVGVGVDDLSLVPPALALHVGGAIHNVPLYTVAWKRTPLYTAADMPKQSKVYRRPQPPPSSTDSDREDRNDDQQLIPMSSQVLRYLCRGRTADSLPPELRHFATLEEIHLEDPHNTDNFTATNDQDAFEHSDFLSQQATRQNTENPTEQRSAGMLHTPDVTKGVKDRVEALIVGHTTNRGSTGRSRSGGHTNASSQGPSYTDKEASDRVVNRHPTQDKEPSVIRQTSGPQKILLKDKSGTAGPILSQPRAQTARRIPLSLGKHVASDKIKGKGKAVLESAGSSHVSKARIPVPNLVTSEVGGGHVFRAQKDRKTSGPKQVGSNTKPTKRFEPRRPKRPNATVAQFNQTALHSNNKRSRQGGPRSNVARSGGTSERDAQISFNPAKFYEVKVQYEHISRLATGCGLKPIDVERAIDTDNRIRQEAQLPQNDDPENTEQVDEGRQFDLSRFDLDPNDELTSEEELA